MVDEGKMPRTSIDSMLSLNLPAHDIYEAENFVRFAFYILSNNLHCQIKGVVLAD